MVRLMERLLVVQINFRCKELCFYSDLSRNYFSVRPLNLFISKINFAKFRINDPIAKVYSLKFVIFGRSNSESLFSQNICPLKFLPLRYISDERMVQFHLLLFFLFNSSVEWACYINDISFFCLLVNNYDVWCVPVYGRFVQRNPIESLQCHFLAPCQMFVYTTWFQLEVKLDVFCTSPKEQPH